MELSEQAKRAIESEVASHEGKKLVRLLKFMRGGKPMLQMAFEKYEPLLLKAGTTSSSR